MRSLMIVVFACTWLFVCPAFGQQNPIESGSYQGLLDNYQQLLNLESRGLTYHAGVRNPSARVRFVRFEKVEDSRKKSIREDAAVLNHMISKQLPLKNPLSALGVSYTRAYGKNELVYDERGLTLVYHVPVQLVPGVPPETATEDFTNPKSDWEKAKEELSGSSAQKIMTTSNTAVDLTTVQKFSQDYVDRITTRIRSALSNAGNIRDLSDDDMITVFVFGRSVDPSSRSVMAWRVKWKNLQSDKADRESMIEESVYVEKIDSRFYRPIGRSTR